MVRNYKHEYQVVKENEIIKIFFSEEDEIKSYEFAVNNSADFVRHIVYIDTYCGNEYENQYKKCYDSLIWTKEQGILPTSLPNVSIGSLNDIIIHQLFEGISQYLKELYGAEPSDFELTGNINIENITW